jgi:uncharacterized protein YecT (DUF1311 family)
MKNRRFGQLATLLLCALSGALVDAACLDTDRASSPCRYPAGDAWCARNGGGNPYAYKDGCIDEGQRSEADASIRAPVKSAPGDPVAVWDCAKARTRVERLICDNPDIRALDARMGALYSELQTLGLSPERMQKAWLRNERGACNDADCLRAVYAERIRVFESLARPDAAADETVDADPGPVAPLVGPPTPGPEAVPNPASPPAAEQALPAGMASSSEPTMPTDGSPTFLPALPQPELPSREGQDPALGGAFGADSHQPARMSGGLVMAGATLLILTIALVVWVRRRGIQGAMASFRERLRIPARRLRTASVAWLAELRQRRARAARLVSETHPEEPSRAADSRLSDDMLERLRALARPGEALSSVIGRAIAALEAASDQPPATAVLSRMAALEARLAQLEVERSSPKDR